MVVMVVIMMMVLITIINIAMMLVKTVMIILVQMKEVEMIYHNISLYMHNTLSCYVSNIYKTPHPHDWVSYILIHSLTSHPHC